MTPLWPTTPPKLVSAVEFKPRRSASHRVVWLVGHTTNKSSTRGLGGQSVESLAKVTNCPELPAGWDIIIDYQVASAARSAAPHWRASSFVMHRHKMKRAQGGSDLWPGGNRMFPKTEATDRDLSSHTWTCASQPDLEVQQAAASLLQCLGWKTRLNTVSTDLRALLRDRLELGRRRRQLWLTPATEAPKRLISIHSFPYSSNEHRLRLICMLRRGRVSGRTA